MVFSSINFLFYFLPIVLLAYYCAPRGLRNAVLFLASLFFYAWGEPVYVLLMLFSTLVDFVCGAVAAEGKNTPRAKAALFTSVVINLALLGFFKYGGFVVDNLNGLLGTAIPRPMLSLPVGISFYTFQTMSYTIDIYRGQARQQKNILDFGTYVALFPQLIAGPIVRYSDVAAQLGGRRENMTQFARGVRRFVAGLGKKVLLANNIGAVWEQVSQTPWEQRSVLEAWLGIVAFAFQIYFDFSGYSDMAIGLGKMFGFDFLENFDYPYVSKSITEFWRRWHISLGTWFREYVYIPMGGNRQGRARQLCNIAVVWLLTGIWHGASWNFVLWGGYYCILLIAEKLFLLRALKGAPALVAHGYTCLAVLMGWVLFAFEDLAAGAVFAGQMVGVGAEFVNDRAIFLLQSNGVLLVVLAVAATPLPARWGRRLVGLRQRFLAPVAAVNGALVVVFLLSVAYLVDSTYNPFLYFRF